jgi:CHASE2 domain-containing sensor protein
MSDSDPNGTTDAKAHPESFLQSFLFGVVVIAAVIIAKTGIERTRTGQWIELASYEFLQFRMASSQLTKNLDVAVLDISGLPRPDKDNQVLQTSPSNIEDLVSALATCSPTPRGIGIDIDYSPREKESEPNAALRRLLDSCLRTSERGIPVFVGIARTVAEKPDRWLWEPAYESLAANLLIPNEHNGVRKMWLWFEVQEIGSRSKCLSAALVKRVAKPPSNLAWLSEWAIEQFKTENYTSNGVTCTAEEFLVDYAPLDQIKNSALNSVRVESVKGNEELFSGKFVLIGDSKAPSPEDKFVIPGRRDLVPGVLLNACAVHTLSGSPVFELTAPGRTALDAVFAGTVLGLTLGIDWFTRKKIGRRIDRVRVHRVLTWLVVLCGLMAGVVFVHFTRVIWNDFLFVIAALLVHSRFEHLLEGCIKWTKEAGRRFLHGLLKPESKPKE